MRKILKDFWTQLKRTMFIVIAMGVMLITPDVWAATYYMPDDFANLQAAAAGMSGGDILIIRDGTYSGTNNTLNQFTLPPSGSAAQFTTIKAEHDGKAIFPDSFLIMNNTASETYISFEGLKSLNEVMIYGVSHFKFLRCSFSYDNAPGDSAGAPLWISHSSYVLVEDCWAWGAGRYRFVLGGDHFVLRRCVARFDRTDWHDPMANFSSYDADYVAYQNCIAIDSDHDEFWLNTEERAGNFYVHHGSTDNVIDGCIGINNKNYFAGGSPDAGFNVKNSMAINTGGGINLRADHGLSAGYDIDHCSFYNINRTIYPEGNGVDTWGGNNQSVSSISSVYYGIADIALKGANLGGNLTGYNVFYNNTTDHAGNSPVLSDYCTANSNAIDPIDGTPGNGIAGILYPVRVEINSNLSGTGSNGSDRGANILYKIGVDGTFWGDPGWDVVTSEPLWPWPNEDRIREDMRSYSYTGVTTDGSIRTLSGKRGFCADGKQLNGVDDITLTSYIWEYLGNQIPSDIYKNTPPEPDTTPPVVSNIGATTTATTATISWTTNESATGQVDYGPTVGYGQQQTTSLTTSHQVNIADLQPATTYHYKITCSDSSGNTFESIDYSFTTQELDSGDDKDAASSAFSTLQDFEDGILWVPGGSQDPTGNGRGWAFLDAGSNAAIEIDPSVGANNTGKSLKITFDSDNPQIYFRSNDKLTDRMPEAAGANRMSFYIRFPEGFPIQTLPFRYDTWQLGTYIHDPDDWSDLHAATFEDDHGIHHYYHRLTIEEVGNGWVKYIVTTQPDQANYSGSTVPPNITNYFDRFGRFYFHFGPEAGGPEIPRPFTIWIDEIKFYHDDGTVGGEIHVGGQDDAGFDGEFIPDSATSPVHSPQDFQAEVQ